MPSCAASNALPANHGLDRLKRLAAASLVVLAGVGASAHAAAPFMTSVLPPRQTLQPGDWGQGFTTVDLPAGTRFNLNYEWKQDAIEHHAVVRGAQCAARNSQP